MCVPVVFVVVCRGEKCCANQSTTCAFPCRSTHRAQSFRTQIKLDASEAPLHTLCRSHQTFSCTQSAPPHSQQHQQRRSSNTASIISCQISVLTAASISQNDLRRHQPAVQVLSSCLWWLTWRWAGQVSPPAVRSSAPPLSGCGSSVLC